MNQQEIYKGCLSQGFPDLVVHANSCIHSFNSYLVNAHFVIGTLPSCPPLLQPPPPQSQKSIVLCISHLGKFILTISLYFFIQIQHAWVLFFLYVEEIFEIRAKQRKKSMYLKPFFWGGEKIASLVAKSKSYIEHIFQNSHTQILWDIRNVLRI